MKLVIERVLTTNPVTWSGIQFSILGRLVNFLKTPFFGYTKMSLSFCSNLLTVDKYHTSLMPYQ